MPKNNTGKRYPEHIIEEAKLLCVKKKYGRHKILVALQEKYPEETKGLQESSIGKWIATKKWRELRSKVAKRTEEKFIADAVKENIKELEWIDKGIDYVLNDMSEKEVKSNLSNLTELVKLRMLKRGESTERVDNDFKIVINYPKKD